ncbi:GAF domain-containing sensor histidine kinase [soil metagenome]
MIAGSPGGSRGPASLPAGPSPAAEAAFGPSSLYGQIKLARFWLPLAILVLVLAYQLLIVPLGDARWEFWSTLLFYGILGPVVTFVTLTWIASQVKGRELAQNELRELYTELRASHELLAAIQNVTERFAAATDLDSVLSAASEGVAEVTGAEAAAVSLGLGGLGVVRGHGLTAFLGERVLARAEALSRQEALSDTEQGEESGRLWVLTMPLVWGQALEGSLHAFYRAEPSHDQRESFSILGSQFSAVAEASRGRTKDLLTLFEVDRSIRAEGNLERLLGTLLTQTMQRAGASLGGVYLADEDGLLQLKAWHGLSANPSVTPLSARVGEGFIGKAAEAGEPRIAGNLSGEARLTGGPVLARAESVISLPLEADEGLLGIIVLAHESAAYFSEASLPFLSLMAGQVTLAVRNARAYLQSEELAIVEERARIAREIHDGVAQSLAFSALKLDLALKLLAKDPQKAASELNATKTTIRETIKEVRRSIFALRPIDLERHGFAEAIRRYAVDYGQQNDIRVALQVEAPPQLTLKSEAVLYRIFQETMNNVAKHSSASSVEVTVGTTAERHSFIRIRDDGRGFDPEGVSGRITSAGGLGLLQMCERVEARRGRFEVSSSPGAGTQVYASVPE